MPRKARGLLEGEQHHVIIKGHNGEPIVSGPQDAERLLVFLAAALVATGGQVAVLAWALLTNHMHLVIAGPIEAVSGAMHAALGPYAQLRNLRMERRGRLFIDRFWSSPIHDEPYQVAALLYTLLNPLKAGIVHTIDALASHRLCNLGELLGGAVHDLLPGAVAQALDIFGTDPAAARAELRTCLDLRVEKWREHQQMESIDAIAHVVCARHGLLPETLLAGSRDFFYVRARRETAALAIERLAATDADLSRALNLSRQSISAITKPLRKRVS